MKEFNSYIKEISGSKSIELMDLASQIEEDGGKIINMAGGEPDFNTPQLITESAVTSLRNGDTHYLVGKGLRELRERIAEKERIRNGIECSVEDIIITPGAKFGIYMAVASLINAGDEVIIFSPMWVSYVPIVEACGGVPIICELNPEENYRLIKEDIEKCISEKTKAIIINYPNNPTGKVLSDVESKILFDIVKEYDVYLISDEIYNEIVFDGLRSKSMASYKEIADKVITINGFSKSAAMTGWRIGYVIATGNITNVMYKLFAHTITGVSTFIQKASLKVFECEKEIEKMRQIYQERRDYFINELNSLPNITCFMPQGAFYAWIKIERDNKERELASELLAETGILGVPGTAYGAKEDNYIRLSFACSKEILKQALEALKNWDKIN